MSKMVVQFIADTTNLQAGMATLNGQLAAFGTNAQKNMLYASGSMAAVGGAFQTAGNTLVGVGSALTQYVTIPLGLASVAAFKAGVDFETAFAGVKKTINGTEEEFKALETEVLRIASSTGIANEKVSGIMQMAGQLGIRGKESLTLFTEEVANLGITTGMSTDQLSMMLGKFLAISGTDVEKDMKAISSVITELGNTSATTESDIIRFGVRIAAVGRLSGISEKDILALAAAAEASGTKAERGGTALTKVFLRIQSEVYGAAEATESYSKTISENDTKIAEWTRKLEDAKEKQAALGTNATAEEMQALSSEIATASEEIGILVEANKDLQKVSKDTGTETLTFASFLGISNDKLREMYKETDGAMNIFKMFTEKINEAGLAEKDLTKIMGDLGLSDARLVQTMLSMAKANEAVVDANGNLIYSSSSLTETLKSANKAFESQDATAIEVAKRLDTVSGQWGILIERLKAIAVIFTDDQTGVLKEYLKTMNDFLGTIITKLQGMSTEQLKGLMDTLIRIILLGPSLTIFGKTLGGLGTILKSLSGFGGLMKIGMGGGLPKNITDMLGNPADQAAELTRAQGTLGAKLGSLFGGEWFKNAFQVSKYRATIDTFTTDLQTNITNSLSKKIVTLPALVNAGRPRNEAGQFIKSDGMNYSAGAGGLSAGMATTSYEPTAASVMFTKVASAMPAVITGLGNIMAILASMAAVIALVSVGFTIFFMSTGKELWEVERIFITTGVSIQNFFSGLGEKLNELKDGFPAFAASFGAMFMTVVSGLGNVIITAITSFFEILPQMLMLGGMFITSLIKGFVDSLPLLLEQAVGIIMAVARGIIDNLPTILFVGMDIIFNLIAGLVRAIPMLLQAALGLVFSLFGLLVEKFMDGTLLEIGAFIVAGLIKGIFTMLGALWDVVVELVMSIIDGIKDFFGIKSPSTVMAEIGEFIIEGLLNGIKWYFEILKTFWTTVPKFLLDAFIGAATWLLDIGKAILTGLWNGIKWYYDTVFKTGFKVGTWIADAFKNSGTWLVTVGKNIMQGLKNGIFEIGGNMGRWVSELGGKFVSGVENFFGIKSPSRVFRGIGNNIGEGLVIGLEDTNKAILAASNDMANAAMIDPAMIDSSMTVDGKVTQNYEGLTQALITALEAVGLNVYIDGREVTDKFQRELVLSQRRVG